MKKDRVQSITITILILVAVLFAFSACTAQPATDLATLDKNLELNWVAKIVEALYKAIGNYGWTMVLVTVILKVVMLPLDIWQKVSARKSAIQMQEMGPMVEAIDKKYAANPQKANEEKQKLYKKQGYSMTASCLPMMATMAMFFVVFSGVNNYSRFRTYEEYKQLYAHYESSYSQAYSQNGNNSDEAVKTAEESTYIYYTEEVQESWLWIKSIWRPDTWETSMDDFAGFATSVGLSTAAAASNAEIGALEESYSVIYDSIVTNGYSGWNGWMLLPICCVALSFLSMWLPQLTDKNKKQAEVNAQQAATNKSMMYIMPLMMAYFGFIYTGAFAVYITCNYALNLISTFAFKGVVENMAQKSIAKSRERNKVEPKASYKR